MRSYVNAFWNLWTIRNLLKHWLKYRRRLKAWSHRERNLSRKWKSFRNTYRRKGTKLITGTRTWIFLFLMKDRNHSQTEFDSVSYKNFWKYSVGYLVISQSLVYHAHFQVKKNSTMLAYNWCSDNRYETKTSKSILYVYENQSWNEDK